VSEHELYEAVRIIEQLETENAELRGALKEYEDVTAFKDCDPADSVVVPRDDWDAIKKALKLFRLKDEGHNECFERVAEMYYKDTGKIAPGKDVPAAAPEYSSTFEEFCVWHKGIVLAALAAIEKGGQDE